MKFASDPAGSRRNGRAVFSWMLFDWAAQPFHSLIVTFIFAPYFASQIASSPERGQELWGYAAGTGGILVALLAPLLGAVSDSVGPRKPWIALFSMAVIVGCALLWFAAPGTDRIWFILSAFVLALVGVEFATVFTNAMMPDLVPSERMGRLSGNGWAVGYVGGVLLLIIMLTLFVGQENGRTLIGLRPVFGLSAETSEGTRASGPISAIWYAVFVLPLFLFVPDSVRRVHVAGATMEGLRRLSITLKTLPRRGSFFAFLMASMAYRDALAGIFAFGGIYAAGVLGWSITQIGLFGILAAVFGALGAWIGGIADDARGPKFVVRASVVILCLCSLTIISLGPNEAFFLAVGGTAEPSSLPDLVFYISGSIFGGAGGALQAASRTLLIHQADKSRMTEAFGLYALCGKATSFIAPLSVALITGMFSSQRIGVVPILVLFLIGLYLLKFVTEGEGTPARLKIINGGNAAYRS